MRRIVTLVTAVVLGLSPLLLTPASPAMAEDTDCSPLVLDHTSQQILGGHNADVLHAAARLIARGANVRVRVEENFDGGAGGYLKTMLARCPSWGTVDGSGNLHADRNMVLMVYGLSVDGDYTQRPARIVVGQMWIDKGLTGDKLNQLIVDKMRPTLLKFDLNDQSTWPDVANGLIAGEDELGKQMAPYDWAPVIFWWVVGIVGGVTLLVLLFRWLGSGGGGTRYGSGYGYSSTTYIATDYGSSGGSFGGGSGDSGSVNC